MQHALWIIYRTRYVAKNNKKKKEREKEKTEKQKKKEESTKGVPGFGLKRRRLLKLSSNTMCDDVTFLISDCSSDELWYVEPGKE